MIYNHKYFILDTNTKRVLDENNKELRLTGNSYRVLVFLCANKSGTVTDIGGYLDFAKDYDENHIRQYRYKINLIIGHDIIKYENNLYFLSSEVLETDKIEKNERNTDLLQQKYVKSKQELNESKVPKKESKKLNKIPALIAIIVLLLSFIDWPLYSYYTFLKIIVTGVAIYYAYYLYDVLKKKNCWCWSLVVIVILFNPIIPIYIYNKSIWMVIDVIVIGFLVGLIIKNKK